MTLKFLIEGCDEEVAIPHIRLLVTEVLILSDEVQKILLRVFERNEEDLSPSQFGNILAEIECMNAQAYDDVLARVSLSSNLYLTERHLDILTEVNNLLTVVYGASLPREDIEKALILSDRICYALTVQNEFWRIQ